MTDHTRQNETQDVSEARSVAKKPFVEPAISQPVDVLEATTFFQVAESGATNGAERPEGAGPGRRPRPKPATRN